nr:phage tail tape measure protein [Armatimonadota bacterium]NIO96345.1 phage tail tape measure protein [Armatimonadota bacterium]
MVLPIASRAGVSLEETSAAMAALTQAGLAASSSSIYLRQMITRIIDPTDELSEALAKMGYESGQAALEEIGLVGVLQGLSQVAGEDAEALVPLFGNIRAATAAMALMKDEAAVYTRIMENMGESEGAVNRAREQQYSSLESQLRRLKSAFESVLITIGDVMLPALTDLAESMVPVLRSFRNIPKPVIKAGIVIGGLVAAIGPLLLVVGQLGMAIPGLVSMLGGLSGALSAMGISASAALGPIGLLATALGLLAIKAIQSSAEMEAQKKQIIETAESAEEAAEKVGELYPPLERAAGGAKTFAADAREAARAQAMAAAETEYYKKQLEGWEEAAYRTEELHDKLAYSGDEVTKSFADAG